MSDFPCTAPRKTSNATWYASAFARFARNRRQKLGMSVAQAAELAGLTVCQWSALESGWVPEDDDLIRTIAATLEVLWSDVTLMALLSRAAQQNLIA